LEIRSFFGDVLSSKEISPDYRTSTDVLRQGKDLLHVTSLYNDATKDDDDVDDDVDGDVTQLIMSTSSSSSTPLPAEVRALLARERSRRRAAEDWATFLVATLDSYVRASNAYDRQIAEPDPNSKG